MDNKMKDIPSLLRDKINSSIDVNDIMGYRYWVDYETTDWDFPIDNNHFDKELIMNDGTYRSHLGFLDHYYRNGKDNSLCLSLNSAGIEVYIGKDSKRETIGIKETDYQSIAYGAFEGLRLWLENILKEQLSHKGLWPAQNQHIRIMARYVHLGTNEEVGRVEFDEPLSETETEQLIGLLFASQSFSPDDLRWHNRDLYHRIERKAEARLAESFGSPHPLAQVAIHWAEKEVYRFAARCRYMTKKDIDEKLSYLDNIEGEIAPIREELLAGIYNCYIWKEVWTRETGHLWENYTLLKRTPNKEEYDYADTWDFYLIPLKNLSTKAIVRMLKEYKK